MGSLCDPPGLNHKIGLFGSARGYPWEAPSPSDFHLSLGGQGVCWFGLVRFGSVWFGGVWRPEKRGKKIKTVRGARQLMLLLKQHHLLVRQGSVWFGVVWRGLAAEKGAKIKIVRVFLWFGSVRSGSAGVGGAEDARWPGGQEEKTHQVVQW